MSNRNIGINLRYFKALGFWQYINGCDSVCLLVILNAAVGGIFVLHVLSQLANTFIGDYPFTEFTEKLAVNLTMLESAIKMGWYCSKRRNLLSLSASFQSNLLKCESHHPYRAWLVLTNSAKTVNRAVKSFVIMIFSTVGLWNSFPILNCCIRGECSRWQITPSWYIFDPKVPPVNAFVYLFEFLIMIYCATLLYTVNCLFYAFALSISSQFEVLKLGLTGINKNADNILKLKDGIKIIEKDDEDDGFSEIDGRITNNKLESKHEIMDSLLRDCLVDHQLLLRLTKQMEDMYNPMFLFQMLMSTLTICLVLVQLNMQSSTSIVTSIKFFMYLVFSLMELLVYSYGGQIIRDRSGEIHWAVYDSGWDEGSVSFGKNVLIAMMRASKEEALTAGKFYNVGLSSFTQIIKASYSYFTFLRGSHYKGSKMD